jgi:hypothetical protein
MRHADLRLPLAAGLLLASLGFATPASALDCGARLVLPGDTAAYVRSVCGEPASIVTRTESRTVFDASRGTAGVSGRSRTETVTIEVWTYDFGPSRLMQALTFESGVLRSIETLRGGSALRLEPPRPSPAQQSMHAHSTVPSLPPKRSIV